MRMQEFRSRPKRGIMTILKHGLILLILASVFGLAPVAIAQLGGTFTATGDMTTARLFQTATLLLDGRVLIAGGSGATAELYDPLTGRFTATGNMHAPRSQQTATLLPNGTVLIAGGDGTPASAELYDPSTGTFTTTGSLSAAPYGLTTATLLPDGRVLIAEGSEPELELYGPTRLWRPT
jgi:hypothetical protein